MIGLPAPLLIKTFGKVNRLVRFGNGRGARLFTLAASTSFATPTPSVVNGTLAVVVVAPAVVSRRPLTVVVDHLGGRKIGVKVELNVFGVGLRSGAVPSLR